MAKGRRKAQVSPEKFIARPDTPAPESRIDWSLAAALVAATLLVYARVGGFAFVNFDDPDYVKTGGHGLLWAFTSVEAANWFPVTRLSHILDGLLFGIRSGGPHLMN